MEVKVRGLDVGAVKILDDLAKKNKMSRNEYLRRQIETLAWLDKIQSERNRFEEALSRVEVTLEIQNRRMRRLNFLLMQALDVTEEELNGFEQLMLNEEIVATERK